MAQVRIAVLNLQEFKIHELFRLEKGWVLRFVLGPSLMGHQVRLFCNHPLSSSDAALSTNEFRELQLVSTSQNRRDDLDRAAEITCVKPGPFNYFFLCDTDDVEKPSGSGFFQVTPMLTVGPNNSILPLDCIQCQTVLSKLLGPFNEWENRFRVTHESGYNMLHLTPIQSLGKSNSAYCISEHLAVNPSFDGADSKRTTYEDVGLLIEKMRREWNVLTMSDVVWNHMAETSQWLHANPSASYNMLNAPHLRPAYLLDRLLALFGEEVARGVWEKRGLPARICEEYHLQALRSILQDEVLPQCRFHEFFQVPIDAVAEEFHNEIKNVGGSCTDGTGGNVHLVIVQDREYRRFASGINMQLALILYNKHWDNCQNEGERRHRSVNELRNRLTALNNEAAEQCWQHLCVAVDALIGHVRYERVQHGGLRLTEYNETNPLFTTYFTHFGANVNIETEEKDMYNPLKCALFMAHNGWVMVDEPLKNFAELPSMVYFRRELICWGDNVKLRYGSSRADCPPLWDLMTEYTKQTARIFHGIRIDNCHSTPINAAEALLAEARKVRPDLYVVAELFTGKEEIDNIFVNRLGICSLVREAQSAGDAHEQGRLVYRYGGEPVGAFMQPDVRPLAPSIAHAIFMDQTHDNPSPIERRSVYDLLPTAALVAMSCCATGSNRGYDELVSYQIDVVKEKRHYTSWTDGDAKTGLGTVNATTGIVKGRALLNQLHYDLGKGGFNQVYVDQRSADTIAVTRHSPQTHQKVILVARTAFQATVNSGGLVPHLHIDGVIDEIIFEAKLRKKTAEGASSGGSGGGNERKEKKKRKHVEGAHHFILGLQEYELEYHEHVKPYTSEMVEIQVTSAEDGQNDIDFTDFPPGSIVAFSVSMPRAAKQAILEIRSGLVNFGYAMKTYSGKNLDKGVKSAFNLTAIVSRMRLQDLNRALFRCNEEEADEGRGGGAYYIPRFGAFTYCGLQGVISVLNDVRFKNDLGHPFCDNVRQGLWLAEYIANRLQQEPGTKELGQWLSIAFKQLEMTPHYLRPCYFDAIVTGVFSTLLEACWSNMSSFVQEGSDFVKALALSSVLFCGYSRNACLPMLSEKIHPPLPPMIVDERTAQQKQACVTLAAGFPHFACGLFRNWGRDTFIAMPGLLLIPGRFDEARFMILAFAGCLRHGLIPNLLGEGVCARYNCRDSVWWWLRCIKCFCTSGGPNGDDILSDTVRRLYPKDDTAVGNATDIIEQPLHETMQEALSRHFAGIDFRERNAGRAIDEHMADEGFHVVAGVNAETGFVYGGNSFNCGTWMDKMGSSHKAGNAGKPATPRDGSAIELVGLSYELASWLSTMHASGKYPHAGVSHVENGAEKLCTWTDWAKKIQAHFEEHFWIPSANEALPPTCDAKLINKRGVYKDTYGSATPWADYQLRPNFAMAMAVAPELFNAEHAWTALEQAEKSLFAPASLGMKTLDPTDWAYDGNYDNADDSHEQRRAKGFNYHQGPEWLWMTGYFLRAKLAIVKRLAKKRPALLDETVRDVQQRLSRHWTFIQRSTWRALPELTNENGNECRDSCNAQAWSMACLLEVVEDMSSLDAASS